MKSITYSFSISLIWPEGHITTHRIPCLDKEDALEQYRKVQALIADRPTAELIAYIELQLGTGDYKLDYYINKYPKLADIDAIISPDIVRVESEMTYIYPENLLTS